MTDDTSTETTEVTSATVTSADIADFDTVASSDQGADMEVRHPKTNEVLRHADGRPFTITFRGKDSAAVREVSRKQQDRRVQTQMRTRAPVLAAVVEKDDVELLVAATIKWDIILGGKPPKNDPREYREAFAKYAWLKEQGDEFVGIRSNFIKS